MKKLLTVLTVLATTAFAYAQPANIATEEKPFINDGIEYGYAIRNAGAKEVVSKNFSQNLGGNESEIYAGKIRLLKCHRSKAHHQIG